MRRSWTVNAAIVAIAFEAIPAGFGALGAVAAAVQNLPGNPSPVALLAIALVAGLSAVLLAGVASGVSAGSKKWWSIGVGLLSVQIIATVAWFLAHNDAGRAWQGQIVPALALALLLTPSTRLHASAPSGPRPVEPEIT